MSTDIVLRCACGSLRGRGCGLSSATGIRLVCYCVDCQTYAHYLGRPKEILDAAGGTEVFQTVPRRLSIEAGREHLRCLRQSPKGALRWYAGCCGTPFANGMANPRIPFASLVQPIMIFEDRAEHDAALGPIRGALFTGDAHAAPLHRAASPFTLLKAVARIGVGFVRGSPRPNCFFRADGRPVVAPEQMPLEERKALQAKVRGTA